MLTTPKGWYKGVAGFSGINFDSDFLGLDNGGGRVTLDGLLIGTGDRTLGTDIVGGMGDDLISDIVPGVGIARLARLRLSDRDCGKEIFGV
jgi:hypothetical protein